LGGKISLSIGIASGAGKQDKEKLSGLSCTLLEDRFRRLVEVRASDGL
jgi:hypothetical protein